MTSKYSLENIPGLAPPPPKYSHAILVTGSRTWNDEPDMRRAFNRVWKEWDLSSDDSRPLLISGHAPRGADSMAERIWTSRGLELVTFPADWEKHGHRAGTQRNQAMVDFAVELQKEGTQVVCAAFHDLCSRSSCPQEREQQLQAQGWGGHYSHGTVHCRNAALRAGITVLDSVLARRWGHPPQRT